MTEFNPNKVRPTMGQADDNVPLSAEELQQQLAEATAKLSMYEKEHETLETENNELRRGIIEAPRKQAEVTAVNDIMKGFDKTYKHDYSFNVIEGSPIKFSVELRPATALDALEIGNRASELSNGRIAILDGGTAELVQAVATLGVVGERVPSFLTDMDKTYRVDIIKQVYYDYLEWLDRFRQRQEY